MHNRVEPQWLERSCDFGPCERFSAAEGIAGADDQVLAFASKLGDWSCCDDGHWVVMVVTGAGWRRCRVRKVSIRRNGSPAWREAPA